MIDGQVLLISAELRHMLLIDPHQSSQPPLLLICNQKAIDQMDLISQASDQTDHRQNGVDHEGQRDVARASTIAPAVIP